MTTPPALHRRFWLTGATVATFTTALGVASAAQARPAEDGPGASQTLDKLRKGGALRVGFAQTPLWFFRDPRSGQLKGVYHDLAEQLAKELAVKVEWHEVTFGNLTLGLRKGDYDVFGSSAIYTVPRALAANYIGPLWSKGELAVVRSVDAAKFPTAEALNSPDVTIAVTTGASEQTTLPPIFPKAKFIAVTGQVLAEAEPVRAGRASAFVIGDSDALTFVKHNAWARVVDPQHPINRRPNTWLVRYSDEPWKNFLDMWSTAVTVNGDVKRLYEKYLAVLT